jgi:hypothetical protein
MRLTEWVTESNAKDGKGKGAVTFLAKKADLTFATVARIVKGQTVPDADTALALSRATEGRCSVQEILEEAVAARDARKRGEAA